MQVVELLESEAGLTAKELEVKETEVSGKVDTVNIYKQAAILLLAGAGTAAVFADPMVDSIGAFSKASGIPPFFVAFVVTPFASNASELLSSIIFARKRRKRNISLTFSQIYGAITMNNTLCLAIFLALVYLRDLTWDFSSEVKKGKISAHHIQELLTNHYTAPWSSLQPHFQAGLHCLC
jgi:Ca2+/Na+ antiporter